jgi:hypothetical protein
VGLEIVPSLRSRGGIPDEVAIVSVFRDWLLCAMVSCRGGLSFCRGGMLMKVGLESGETIEECWQKCPILCQVNLHCTLGSECPRCYLLEQTDRSSHYGASLSSRY